MTNPIGSCEVCRCIASALCVECGAYICDPVCAEAHKADHRYSNNRKLGKAHPKIQGRAA